MDYREVLEQLRGYVQKPVSEEAGKICKTVRALNREQMAVLLTDSEKDIDSLEVQLQNSEYVIALKKELVKSDIDEILYQLGKFEGMTRITAAAKPGRRKRPEYKGPSGEYYPRRRQQIFFIIFMNTPTPGMEKLRKLFL